MFLDHTFYPESCFEDEKIEINVPIDIFMNTEEVVDDEFMNNTKKRERLTIDFGLDL